MGVQQLGLGASEYRLTRLIEERLKPNSNKKLIDERIWDLFGETWAVMFTDLEGFSRGVAEFGIIHFLQLIHESQRIFVPCIEEADGYLLKIEADSMLVIFHTVEKAVNCAIAMQRSCKSYNKDKPETSQLLLGVGLGYGKVLRIGDHDVFGAEVNAASKLGEDTAEAWEILVTDEVKKASPGYKYEPISYVPPGATGASKLLYTL